MSTKEKLHPLSIMKRNVLLQSIQVLEYNMLYRMGRMMMTLMLMMIILTKMQNWFNILDRGHMDWRVHMVQVKIRNQPRVHS